MLGTDLALEGPFKKGYQGSYLINYRYSSLALLQRAGLEIVGDAVPNFQDLSYNVFLPTKKYGNFSLFGIAGLSRINQEFPTKTFISKSTYKTTMAVGGITHAYTIGDKALIKTVVAYTSTSSNYNEKEHDTVEVFRRTLFDENFNNTAFRTSSYLNYKINASHSIKFGVIHSLLGYNMDANWYNRHENLHEQLLQSKGNTAMFQSYVNWRNRITDKITLNTGLHYTKFLLNNKQTIEPRAGIKWALDARQNISAGFGIHSRAEDPSFYMIQRLNNNDEYEQINRDLDFSKARHYVLGYERLLTENLNLKAETYYQELYNIPVSKFEKNAMSAINLNNGFEGVAAVNEGTGTNYGIDLTLEKFFSKNYFFLVTSSFFNSKYKGSDGIERNTTFNRQYAGNVLAGKEFSMGKDNKNVFSISLRFVAAGGRYFSPILLQKSIEAERTIYDEERAFSEKSKDYFRTDFQLSYTINKKRTASV